MSSGGGGGSGSDRTMSPPEAMSSPELADEEMICNICLVRWGSPSAVLCCHPTGVGFTQEASW